MLEICVELGMMKCERISIDGTKIEANNSRHKLTYRKTLERRKSRYEQGISQILEEAEKIDAEEDHLYGDKDGYSMERAHSSKRYRKR